MRNLRILFLTTVIALCAVDAFPCGDKFLVVGRGMRYERAYPAAHPSSILVFGTDTKERKDLETILKKSGHKTQLVSDESTLFTNLEKNKYDLVLVSLADVTRLEAKVISTQFKPAVLPVIYNATGSELDVAKKQYNCVLKYSGKNKNAITVIDEVMAAKKKGAPLICKWAK